MFGVSLQAVPCYSRINHYLNLKNLAKEKKNQAESLIGIDKSLGWIGVCQNFFKDRNLGRWH